VNLLAHPLNLVTDNSQIEKDLKFYEKVMSPSGPAMGSAILSILYNRLGDAKKSADVFAYSYKRNEVPPFGVISEAAGGTNPYFATGAGGMLQAVLSGFGGLNFSKDGIIQNESSIPASWKELIITGIGRNEKTFKVK
ncbi:MAG: glycoside hydrolase family 65 protein, partial [Bacteroidota bacterium]